MNSCLLIDNCIEPEGNIVKQKLELSEISSFNIKGSADVFLKQGNEQSIEVEGYENHLEILNKEVNGKNWNIRFEQSVCDADLKVYLTLKDLEAVKIYGSGNVQSNDYFESENLELTIKGSGDIDLSVEAVHIKSDIYGSGNIKLSGNANEHHMNSKGSGDFNCFDLNTKDCSVDLAGSGKAKVNVSDNLKIDVKGSGDVFYKGNAKVKSSMKGSGNIERVN